MTGRRQCAWMAFDICLFCVLLALLDHYDVPDQHRFMSGMFADWGFQWRALLFVSPIWLLSLFFTRKYLSEGNSGRYGLAVLCSLPAVGIVMIALVLLLPLMFPSDGM